MDDTLVCPVCKNKLTNINLYNKRLFNKISNYVERTCIGINHTLRLYTELVSNNVDFLKLSLSPKYSIFVEINYIDNNTRIQCLKENKSKYIDIPKILIPDFPDLIELKKRISLYITFS